MFETAIPGAGYGYGTQQVVPPPGAYGNIGGQFGQAAGVPVAGTLGQPPFGGQTGAGLTGFMAQRFGGYQTPQSLLPYTIGAGAIPFQQYQQPFGQPQLGQWQSGLPQVSQLQFGQPQLGQWQSGLPQVGQPQFGQPQFWGQQLGMTQTQIHVIPVVTPQGIGVLLLATGQPLVIGATAGGLPGGLAQYGYGVPQGMIGGVQAGLGGQIGGLGGGYLPLQVQQPIPQLTPQAFGPAIPFAAPSFPGQPLGAVPIH